MADLVVFWPANVVELVQCKRDGKLSMVEETSLKNMAIHLDCYATLAYKKNHKIHFDIIQQPKEV